MRSFAVAKLWYTLLAILLTPHTLAQTPAPDDTLAAARLLFRQGDFKAAAVAYQAIISKDHSSADAHAGLVQSLLKQDDVPAAAGNSLKALEALPQSAPIHAARADVLFRRGLIPEAESEYNAAIKLDEKCARAWLGMGRMDAVLARHRRAQEAVSKAHELDPEDGDALYEWAIRQPYPGNVVALEKHLAEFHSDPETEGHERDYVELLKALAGRKVWILDPDVSRSELKLEILTAGPKFTQRGYGLRVKFNDRATATLLLDTGSSGVTITRRFAERIGARKLSGQAIEGVGKGGAARGYQAWVDKVAAGDLEFHDCYVHVVPAAIADTDGTIGADVFNKFLITLDFTARKLRLEPLPKPSFPEDGRPAEAESFTQAYGFGHFLLLPTEIGGRASGLFVIDTGANINSVSPELAKGISQMRALNTLVFGASGSVNSALVADNISLRFSKVHRDARIISVDLHSVSKDLGTEISGQIGFNTFDHMKIIINYRDGLVDFDYKP